MGDRTIIFRQLGVALVFAIVSSYASGAHAQLDSLQCGKIWYERNSIFARNGHCFQTPEAQAFFGRGCFAPYGRLTKTEEQEVLRLQRFERLGNCPKSPDLTGLPISAKTYEVQQSVAGGVLNMRQGPGTTHAQVAAIPASSGGIKLKLCRESDDGVSTYRWCLAEWNRQIAWISTCCIKEEMASAEQLSLAQGASSAVPGSHNSAPPKLLREQTGERFREKEEDSTLRSGNRRQLLDDEARTRREQNYDDLQHKEIRRQKEYQMAEAQRQRRASEMEKKEKPKESKQEIAIPGDLPNIGGVLIGALAVIGFLGYFAFIALRWIDENITGRLFGKICPQCKKKTLKVVKNWNEPAGQSQSSKVSRVTGGTMIYTTEIGTNIVVRACSSCGYSTEQRRAYKREDTRGLH